MALRPGDTLLNRQYRIVRQIGRGGFGFVYLAQDTHLGEQVAIKELIPGLVGDEAMLKRFLAEAKMTLRLTHPRIVRTHHVFPERGNYYIAMEYMPGGSLEARLKDKGPLPVREARQVAVHICEALSYAHSQGVVHCDLKPANILFDAGGSAKVADFGIAHVSEEILTRTWQTPQGFVAGTVPYMSPEQTDGVRDDPRVDVYALGAILYRMLTGSTYLDFDLRETPSAQAHNVMRIHRQDPVPPSTRNRQIPGWLDAVVMKALAKQPQERYSSAGDLRSALVQRTGAAPVRAKPVPSTPARGARQRQQAPSRLWLWLLVAAAAVLVLLVVVLALAVDGGPGPVAGPTSSEGVGVTVTPTLQATAAPTAIPRLEGDPYDWLPGPDDVPEEMFLSASEEYSNETIARQYENPAEVFSQLDEWGRITGYGDTYLHSNGCESPTGLREVFVEAVLFETEAGARAQLAWHRELREQGTGSVETVDEVGASGNAVWSDLTSDCTPPDDLRRVHISFQRYNAIGVASVSSVAGTMSDADMWSLCLRLAQLIDLRFVAEAR